MFLNQHNFILRYLSDTNIWKKNNQTLLKSNNIKDLFGDYIRVNEYQTTNMRLPTYD